MMSAHCSWLTVGFLKKLPALPMTAGSGFHNEVTGRLLQQAPAGDLNLKHQGFDVPSEHDIAATAQHKLGQGRQFRFRQHGPQVLLAENAHQGVGLGHNVEGIEGLEWDVFLD